MSFGISNRFRFYYEYILRYDLLLKLNYNNIMQVPQICKINILALCFSSSNKSVKNISLALEIICGQQVFCRAYGPMSIGTVYSLNQGSREFRKTTNLTILNKREKNTTIMRYTSNSQSKSTLFLCSLRAQTMYNFLEKLITILFQSYDYKIQIHKQEIQITLSNREIRLFPEIQNHFEFFECVQSFQVTIITSSSNEKETQLLWAGLHQKEI